MNSRLLACLALLLSACLGEEPPLAESSAALEVTLLGHARPHRWHEADSDRVLAHEADPRRLRGLRVPPIPAR